MTGAALADDEDLCRRCGVSCHLAIPVNGLPIAVPGLHCQFLVESQRGQFACSVYAERFIRAPWCMTADAAASQGFLARDCPYALRADARSGKVRPGPRALAPLMPAILAEIRRAGVPDWVARAPLVALFRRHGDVDVLLEDDPARPGQLRIRDRVPVETP